MYMRPYDPLEHPEVHWDQVPAEGKVILDLGAGHWNSCVPTATEWFMAHGAKKVIAVDINEESLRIVEALSQEIRGSDGDLEIVNREISSPEDIVALLTEHTPDAVKCDVEGAEIHLINTPDDDFAKVKFYAVECHLFKQPDMRTLLEEKFERCGYTVSKCWKHPNHDVEIISASKN